MMYMVEIRSPSGAKATKAYEASSIRIAQRLAELELQRYPQFEVTSIRQRAEWDIEEPSDDW